MSLEVTNFNKVYSRFRLFNKYEAVKNLSFAIEKGQIYALIGQNGVGKTTTIKAMLKFVKITSGSINFNGEDIGKLMNMNKVGYMPEFLTFPALSTLNSYLKDLTMLKGMDVKKSKDKITQLINHFDLDKAVNKPVAKFSKGMKRKVAFIQAVMNEPEFLVLDEPTDGLDPITRRKMLNYVKDMARQGTTILITSHILSDLEEIADKVGLMNSGELIAEINPKDYMKKNQIIDIVVNCKNKTDEVEKSYPLQSGNIISFQQIDELTIKQADVKSIGLEDWYFEMLKERNSKDA